MLAIKHIAVCFLHSNLNPQNELKIAEFFRAKGIEVFCSSDEEKNLDELTRFRKTLMRARLSFRKLQIEKAIEPLQAEFAGLEAFCLNSIPSSLSHPIEKYKPEPGTAHLDLGLENFLLKDTNHFWELKLSATSALSSGFFHVPGFSAQSLSFDPGPMLMGKSFIPCLIDFLFAAEGFHSFEEYGLSPLNPEKTKTRVLEALLAMVRNNQERRHIDLQKEISNLEKILACELWSEMIVLSAFRKLKVSGPLAKPMMKILKNYKPQGIEISLVENHDFFLTSVLEGIQI